MGTSRCRGVALLNARTAVAEPRSSLKGGEEKSPYSANFSTPGRILLDGEYTIALFLNNNIGPLRLRHPACALAGCPPKSDEDLSDLGEAGGGIL